MPEMEKLKKKIILYIQHNHILQYICFLDACYCHNLSVFDFKLVPLSAGLGSATSRSRLYPIHLQSAVGFRLSSVICTIFWCFSPA